MKSHEHGACDCALTWGAARSRAMKLLKSRTAIQKASNPLDEDEFLLIVQELAQRLSKITAKVQRGHIIAALRAMRFDYTRLTGAEVAQVARAVSVALSAIPQEALPQIADTMLVTVSRTILDTRIAAAAIFSWDIRTSFTAVDERMTKVLGNISTWVLDEYGRRQSIVTGGIADTINRGIARGLRNEDITRELKALTLGQYSKPRSDRYWHIVATNAVNRARMWGHLSSMDEAGVVNYQFEAVLDERTTDQCRTLHGTIFPVKDGLQAYARLAAAQEAGDTTAVERVFPFVRSRTLPNGEKELYVPSGNGGETRVATVVRSGMGRADDTGSVRDMLSPAQLADIGAFMPPLHMSCRSTIVPVFNDSGVPE